MTLRTRVGWGKGSFYAYDTGQWLRLAASNKMMSPSLY